MKKYIFLLILLGIMSILIIDNKNIDFKIKKGEVEKVYKNDIKDELICIDFVENKLSSEKAGIYTNFLDSNDMKDYSTGHEILSESQGLIMLYYVNKANKQKFDFCLEYIEKYMFLKEGMIKWRIKEDNINITNSSASIDDLRIARALIYAYDKWQDLHYLKTLKKISKGLLKHSITDYYLMDYYDSGAKSTSESISLSYLDLYTMNLLSTIDSKWSKEIKQSY